MSTTETLEKISIIQEQLEIIDRKCDGIISRSKAKKFEEGETAEVLQLQYEALSEKHKKLTEELKKLGIFLNVEAGVEVAKEYLPFVKEIVGMAQGEIANTFKLFFDLILDTRNQLEPELDRLSLANAKALFRDFDNLKSAGFPEDRAYQILLARIKPASLAEVVNTTSSAATTASSAATTAASIKSE